MDSGRGNTWHTGLSAKWLLITGGDDGQTKVSYVAPATLAA
jgi:hypothetical protein